MSPAKLSALIAVLVFFVAVGWSINSRPSMEVSSIATSSPSIQTESYEGDPLAALSASSSPFTPLGNSIIAKAMTTYSEASNNGASPQAGESAVKELGAKIDPGVQYKTYSTSDIITTTDTSKDRVINYRADLRTALMPLMDNKVYELDLFASYVETKDTKYLTAIRDTTGKYRAAIQNTEKVVAPTDAASYQAAILTAMSHFAASLDALADNATDPVASAALLKTYLNAESSVVSSFNAIGKYASQKIL